MNILIISSDLPYPKHKNGITSTINNLISEWRKENSINFFYFSHKDIEAEDYCMKFGIKVLHQNLLNDKNEYFIKLGNKYLIKSRNAFSFSFSKFKGLDVDGYDMIFLVGFTSVFLYNQIQSRNNWDNIIFFAADSLSLYYRRCFQNAGGISKLLYYFTQFKTVKSIEKVVYNLVDKVIFVSDVDKDYCTKTFPFIKNKFINVRIGVELYNYEEKILATPKSEINIGFSGIMDYMPNNNAVNFIIDEMVEKLFALDKKIILHIIGKNASERVINYSKAYKNRLIVTGFVDNINLYISSMDIYISPLFIGTGMKNKILQAMGIGVPIICTTVSAEGINDLVDDQNCLICDSTKGEDWVNKIAYLISNPEKMAKFSGVTKTIIKEKYSWDLIAKEIIDASIGGN